MEARFGFAVVTAHVPGSFNTWADELSRNHLDVFHSLAPYASSAPIQVPTAVVEGFLHLDLTELDQMVQFYIKSALAPSTRHTYAMGERRYLQFCDVRLVEKGVAVCLRFLLIRIFIG